MKKLLFSFIIATGMIISFVSCDKDMNNPNASISGTINLISPNNGTSLTLNPNNSNYMFDASKILFDSIRTNRQHYFNDLN